MMTREEKHLRAVSCGMTVQNAVWELSVLLDEITSGKSPQTPSVKVSWRILGDAIEEIKGRIELEKTFRKPGALGEVHSAARMETLVALERARDAVGVLLEDGKATDAEAQRVAALQVSHAARFAARLINGETWLLSGVEGERIGREVAEAEAAAKVAEARAEKYAAQGRADRAEAERKKAERATRKAQDLKRTLLGMEGRLGKKMEQTGRETAQSVVVQLTPGKGGKSGKPRRVYLPETLLDAFREYEKKLKEMPTVNQMELAGDTVVEFKENGRDLGMRGPAFRKLYNIWVQGKRPQTAEEWEALHRGV